MQRTGLMAKAAAPAERAPGFAAQRAQPQRSPAIGNQAALRRLGHAARPPPVLQPKLEVGAIDDPLEHEADAVADAVMRMPDPSLAVSGAPPQVSRKCAACEEEHKKLRMKPAAAPDFASEAPPIVHEVLRSPGQPLDAEIRAFFEPRFGYDFSNVRIHADACAGESAMAVRALAYTIGPDVAFAPGRFAPSSAAGRLLLAHELAHFVQQGGGTDRGMLRRFHLDATGRKKLDCPDYEGDLKLEACLNNEDRLRPGDRDEHVKRVQRGLLLDGADLGPTDADGVYGSYTSQAVIAFKKKYALGSEQFADVGPGTMRQLDELCIPPGPIPPGPPGPTPPVPPVPVFGVTATLPLFVQAPSTPPSMDRSRIPPRVPTTVPITISGPVTPAAPVRVSIDGAGGGNGSATINGAAEVIVTAAGAFNLALQGVDQTAPGSAGNLTLVARQGTTVLASTVGFSVSSLPQDMSFTFGTLVADSHRGFTVNYSFDSDSGETGDLDQVQMAERVEIATTLGRFVGMEPFSHPCYSAAVATWTDKHSVRALPAEAGTLIIHQTFMFKDKRTAAQDIPMRSSGFVIGHQARAKPGGGFEICSAKFGAATTANDQNPKCISDPISSDAGSGSIDPPRCQDI
jgi:peptidoglycan hydrolase-like protein with peptidoglycan-binding domain